MLQYKCDWHQKHNKEKRNKTFEGIFFSFWGLLKLVFIFQYSRSQLSQCYFRAWNLIENDRDLDRFWPFDHVTEGMYLISIQTELGKDKLGIGKYGNLKEIDKNNFLLTIGNGFFWQMTNENFITDIKIKSRNLKSK